MNEIIKKYRESNFYSLGTLANKLGVQIKTIRSWESGKRIGSYLLVKKIRKILKIPDNIQLEVAKGNRNKKKVKIGDNIKNIRIARGYSISELSKKINASEFTVRCWENNKINPSIDYLLELCKVFGVSCDYLLKIKHKTSDKKVFTVNNKQILRIFNKLDEKKKEIILFLIDSLIGA